MFIDEKTGVKIYANLDESVSSATLRPYDITHAFLPVIRDTMEYAQLILSNMPPIHALDDEHDEWWEGDEGAYFINETLFDVLNLYAPEGYYFGDHEGDGADFGYWKIDDGVEYTEIMGTMFNDEQLQLIQEVRDQYKAQKETEEFDEDTFERDLWYTFNRSGLFEKDDDNNRSDISNWGVHHTRIYITEYDEYGR